MPLRSMPLLTENQPSSAYFSILSILLNSELFRTVLSGVIEKWNAARYQGIYKVEAHNVSLDLTDKDGRTAIYTKRQRVTFLQDNVFAIQDQAWGDGDIFVDYHCSPGVAVDRYKEGYRWKILISLRRTCNRNEQEDFVIQRTIKAGFTNPIGNFQTQIDHPTQDLSISVIFPRTRHPKRVTILEQNRKRSSRLGEEHQIVLAQERIQYEWQVHHPRLYESYILHWEW